MTFTSVGYVVLFAATAILYFSVPQRRQNAVLLAASAVFYCANLPGAQNADGTPRPLWLRILPLAALAANILFTFYMAKAIGKAQGKRRKRLTFAAIAACVVVLAIFKYTNHFLPTLITLMCGELPLPLGISFYTFAVISYLVDVSNGEMPPEENLLNWAVFVSFFATITSGPICRAQNLLPQLRKERRFCPQRACDALRLMLWGCFKWVAIANVLGLFVNEVFNAHDTVGGYTGLVLPVAAVFYAFQLYFEFSGYSEIARGTGMFLGLELPVNFKSPLFSTNFSMLWSRWHISLSSWLQDYIFTPLVWSRWTSHLPLVGKRVKKLPVISSVAIVFLVSGFWHGSTWCFVFWGVLQAAYRVGEELLHKYYRKPSPKPTFGVRCFKTFVVFVLWTVSQVFFRVGFKSGGTVGEGIRFFIHSAQNASLSALTSNFVTAVENGFYARPIMVAGYCAFVLLVVSIGIFADWMQIFRLQDRNFSTAIGALPKMRRWLCYYGLLALTLVGFIMQSGGFGTVNFAYANF